jgi:hypothetical protein
MFMQGNCPCCGNWITISGIPNAYMPAAVAFPEPQDMDASASPEKIGRRAANQRFARTGDLPFTALTITPRPETLEFELPETPAPAATPAYLPRNPLPSATRRLAQSFSLKEMGWVQMLLIGIPLFAVLAIAAFKSYRILFPDKPTTDNTSSAVPNEADLIATGLRAFENFLAKSSPEEMATSVIGGNSKIAEIRAYFEDHPDFPHLAETDMIEHCRSNENDLKRGLSAFIYQPLGEAVMEDNMLLAQDVKVGLRAPDMLEQAALLNANNPPSQAKALVCFKIKDSQALLDWDLFIQTWDRKLHDFREGMLGNGPMVFRVVISMDKPVFENGETLEREVVRIQDPLHSMDVIRVQVDSFDPIEIRLRPSPAELEKDPTAGMKPRNATLELQRDPATGQVSIKRVVCMEFLGLGGEEDKP